MEPIFTLPYSEYVVAQRVATALPSAQGFSLHAPLSRQEKGVDLVVTLRTGGLTRAATLQVKASRTYSRPRPSSRAAHDYAFYTWFNVFPVPEQADFVALVAVYPADVARESRARASWWAPLIMLFTQAEMRDFMASVRTRAGQPDRMFGFGFDDEAAVFQTRGDEQGRCRPFSLICSRTEQTTYGPSLRTVMETPGPGALANKEMKLTKPAQATELRSLSPVLGLPRRGSAS